MIKENSRHKIMISILVPITGYWNLAEKNTIETTFD